MKTGNEKYLAVVETNEGFVLDCLDHSEVAEGYCTFEAINQAETDENGAQHRYVFRSTCGKDCFLGIVQECSRNVIGVIRDKYQHCQNNGVCRFSIEDVDY